MVEVVREPDRNVALLGRVERIADDLDEVRRQMEVVDGYLERLLRGRDEFGERVRGPLGRLAAVDQRVDFDARHSALCALFAAWYSTSACAESTSPSVG